MIRVVFDVNVLVSALLFTNSVPRQAFNKALLQGIILISETLKEELTRVLARDKFNRYVYLAEREEFFGGLIRDSTLVEITESIQVCRDPKDDRVLELAVCGNATYIVTGDADLLVLNPFRGIGVLRPADFLRVAHLRGGIA